MEDIKKAESAEAKENAAPKKADIDAKLREKYGKVYRVGMTVPVDDTEEKEFSYCFKRPSVRAMTVISRVRLRRASQRQARRSCWTPLSTKTRSG